MKRFIANLGLCINLALGDWWIFWERKFLKLRMYRAFDICNHNFWMADQNLKLYEHATINW